MLRVVSRLPVLVDLGLPALLGFGLLLNLLPHGAELALEPLFCPHNLALQVEAAALGRIVGVEQPLVALENLLDVGVTTGRGFHIEDLARLVESHAGGERHPTGCVAHLGLVALVLRGGLGLLVRSDKGAAEDSGAREEGGDDEFVRLVCRVSIVKEREIDGIRREPEARLEENWESTACARTIVTKEEDEKVFSSSRVPGRTGLTGCGRQRECVPRSRQRK